jgi:N-acetylglutamate synthase/N-acetylornithine aminotransferase
MPKYVVQWNYKSSLGGPFFEKDVVEMSDALAESINRDSPGVLKNIPLPLPEGKGKKNDGDPVDETVIKDRMVKAAQSHGRGKQEPMTTENFGAVKPEKE